MRIVVAGAGAWGTALAVVLRQNGHEVRLWGHDAARLATLAHDRENVRALPGVALPEGITLEPNLADALAGADGVVVAVPSGAVRTVGRLMSGFGEIGRAHV